MDDQDPGRDENASQPLLATDASPTVLVLPGAAQQKERYPPIPRAALAMVFCTSFAASIQYSMLMPTVWEYVQRCGGTRLILGVVLSSFSFTQTICFPVFGRWSDVRPMRYPFCASFVLGVIGNTIYGLADTFGHSIGVMLAGRLVAGCGAANTGLVASYIARAAPPESRTRLLGINQMVIFVGILCGPALSVLVYAADVQAGPFTLDRCTLAGYLMTLVNAALLVAFPMLFIEPPAAAVALGSGESAIARWKESLRVVFLQRKGWFNLVITFIVAFEISALEAALTPITTDQYGYNAKQNSCLFAAIAGVALTAVAIAIALDRQPRSSPRGIVAGGFAMMATSFVVTFSLNGGAHIPFFGLATFGVLFVMGVMMLPASNMAVFSTKIGNYGKGVFMGYAQIMQGTARILGPLLAGASLHFATHWALFAVLGAIFSIGPSCFCLVWDLFHTKGEWDDYSVHKEKEEKEAAAASRSGFTPGGQSPSLQPVSPPGTM
eukprot:g5103.t1